MSLRDWTIEDRMMLLNELGFGSDGVYVLDKSGQRVVDKYIAEPIKLSNMAIFFYPVITILDDNPLSIVSYFEECIPK